MSDTNILFLPGKPDGGYRWLRIGADGIAARGEGLPQADGCPSIVIVPAEDVTLHWASLPDRSVAQSIAAARALVTEASAAPMAELHVAVGREETGDERPIGVVSTARMRHWLDELASAGVDPEAMIPAPMLLPRPETGFVSGDLGGEGVVRGPATGFADEPGLTDLVTGGVAPVVLPRDALEQAIIAAVAAPALDLRQGNFAVRRRAAIDWRRVRRIGWLVVAILSVTLLTSLVQIMQFGFSADSIERRADMLARQGLPRGESVNDAGRQLDARLARLRGGGLGFSQTAAVLFSAIRAVPGSEVRALSFDADGKLRATLVTQSEGQINDVKRQIEAMGLIVEAGVFEANGGRISGQFTLVAP
ncbi:MAG: general secretion pathway protein GspL [Sphingomonas sp. 28-66-16]|nr:MAG: general secretion pathway protein GspL [Sphingomonas sp. 28-66-16]